MTYLLHQPWPRGRLATILATLMVLAPQTVTAGPDHDLAASGKRLYREGISVSGEPLQAAVRNDVAMEGSDLACTRCHRRSGLGSSEGGIGIAPIAGKTLFTKQTAGVVRDYRKGELSNISRPAYTLETLARALRTGIDSAGAPLSPLMPRYQISDVDVAAIATYLPTLSAGAEDGITPHEAHFATVITPDATPDEQQAMLEVMNAYFSGKNAGTRGETRRAERAPFHREWMYSSYRKWVLHEWKLSGAPETWAAQLERYYRDQPVFAIIGGIGQAEWHPVHEFCEQKEVPCLFPHLDAPPPHAERDFYSLYFSRGLRLEAEALASHLQTSGHSKARIVQVARTRPEQQIAAATLSELLPAADHIHLIDDDTRTDSAFWHQLLERTQPEVLVLWMNEDDIGALRTNPRLPSTTYLSSTLLPKLDPQSLEPQRERFILVHPFQLPGDEQRQTRFRVWARQVGVQDRGLRIQTDTYFVVTLLGEALMHIRGNLSREYLIERIEHMTDSMIYTSTYPRLALAPGQRYAAKGAWIWRLDQPTTSAQWVVP